MTNKQFLVAVTTIMVLGVMQATFAESSVFQEMNENNIEVDVDDDAFNQEEDVLPEAFFQAGNNPLEVRTVLAFGESLEMMIQAEVCSFTHFPDQLGDKRYMGCYDYSFYNDEIEAGMIFVNNALKQFVLFPQMSKFDSIIDDLERFYGTPSSISPPSYFVDVDTKPNASAHIGFDRDTVILELHSDTNFEQSLRLYYLAKE